MTSDEARTLQERCESRIKKVRDSDDVGYYAKMYVEDVEALLQLLKEERSGVFDDEL